MRYFVYSILVWASIATFLYVRDVQKTVYGSIAPDFCTDCPQFYDWEKENE